MNHNPKKAKAASTGWVFLLVLVLCAAAGGGVFYFRKAQKKAPTPEPNKVRAVVHLDTFTVNLSDPATRSYLRLGVDLGVSREEKSSEIPMALVRDTILNDLMAAKPGDLMTIEGKRQLKEQLLRSLQQRAPEIGVREVYFTEFLMQ